jgi:sialate O-acetylesterase
MIVSNDISEADASPGRAIHPPNKKDVGLRLARLALSRTYGVDGFVDSSPFMETVQSQCGKIVVTFSHTGSGLKTRDDAEPDSWEIAGTDNKFVKAKAVIDDDQVVVSADGVQSPAAVRLGWAPDSNCNLVNSAGLPAFPFSSRIE